MRIAIAGPIDLAPLGDFLPEDLPPTYSFPYIGQLARSYRDRSHQVHAFALSEAITEPRTITGDGVVVTILPRTRSGRKRALTQFAAERGYVEDALRRANVDVVHAHWIYEFAAGAIAACGDRVLVTAHDDPMSLIRHYKHPYWISRALLGFTVVKKTTNLTSVSPELARALRRIPGSPKEIDVIPNGISPQFLSTVIAGEEATSSRPKASPPTLLTVANGFDDRKNTSTAIRAFFEFRSINPEARLIMVGVDHGPGGIAERWARSNGLFEGIEFVGRVDSDRMLGFYFRSDVLLHTSRWEACSLAILEAQAAGLIVVGGRDSGGVSYTLGGGSSGILVDVSSVPSVVEGLRKAEEALSGTATSIVETARAHLSRTFNHDLTVSKYVAKLESIAQ